MKVLFQALMMVMTIISATLSCRRDIEAPETRDDLGVVVKKQPCWEVANTADPKIPAGRIADSQIIGNAILDSYAHNPAAQKEKMTLLDMNTGQRKWEWRDLLKEEDGVWLSPRSVHSYEHYLFYDHGPRKYSIDARTGHTIWKQSRPYSTYNGVAYVLGPYYFVKGTPQAMADQSISEDRVYMGDIRSGKETEVVMPRYSRQNIRAAASWKQYIGLITDVKPVVEGRDTLLIVTFNETGPGRNEFQACTGLYNLTQKQWVYERARLDEQFPEAFNSSWLTLSGEKMFTILNNMIACSNWRTGQTLWTRKLPSFAQFPTSAGDYLAVFSTDSRLYLLKPDTGEIIWQMRETPSTGRVTYYDQGILYYLTASLNAVEIPSGKKLWSIESPTNGRMSGHFWGFITGVPGRNGQKGRIFTRTGYHTYCFEAIK